MFEENETKARVEYEKKLTQILKLILKGFILMSSLHHML
jgi:hypothetical protein